MSASVWLTGWLLDQFALDPRAFSLLLAASSVVPLGVWAIASRPHARVARSRRPAAELGDGTPTL
ncbi:MAG TPA: hypothetical protein VFL17_10530 [Anaerolineae bacterium]|nr:hypothetical protein [Anaerolineae bacterium]